MIDYIAESIAMLRANGTRTLLAIIGLSIGIATVVSVQVVGYGLSGSIDRRLSAISSHTFFLQANANQGSYRTTGITMRDLRRLQASHPNISQIYPSYETTAVVGFGHHRVLLGLGATGDQRNISMPMAQGRAFTPADLAARARIAILTYHTFKRLDPDGKPMLGRFIRAGSHTYRVVGILAKPPTGFLAFAFANDVGVPYTTIIRQYIRDSRFYGAVVRVHHVSDMQQTELAVRHQLTHLKHGRATYQTQDRKQLSSQVDGVSMAITLVIGLIGGISLLVAGIGIMNILLVSIAERTREIGIRKAIGAKRSQIMLQFFIEAALLAFGGSLLGCGIGLALGAWVNTAYIVKVLGVIVPIPWLMTVELAVIFATIVTLAFGTYPALRASRLNPIEALRYE
ncbi:MAG: ABC transporter permease [Vulcanimicrobiaceae bacterium]